MAKKNQPPIGFGRAPFDDLDNDPTDGGAKHNPEEKPLEPPLAEPLFVGTMEMYEILQRYGLSTLTPVSPFEYQLVQVIAGLEKRIRELDHDL